MRALQEKGIGPLYRREEQSGGDKTESSGPLSQPRLDRSESRVVVEVETSSGVSGAEVVVSLRI